MRLTHLIQLLLSTCLLLGTQTNYAQAASPTLLVLGDSISAAYGINRDQGWVHLLQQRMEDRGYRYQVINASISGETSRGGLSRLPLLQQRHKPEILIIALGGNDGLRGLSLTSLKENLGQLITASQQYDTRPLLIGIRLPPNYGADYNHRFATVYQQLAKRHDIPLVQRLLDQVADNSQLMQADGIHPTASAQIKILDNVWPILRPILKKHKQNAVNSAQDLKIYDAP